MRVAAIYDIHGNLPALDAALAEIARARPDLILVGGDVASGPGLLPRPTIERLMGLGAAARFVRGNHDRLLLACLDGAPFDPALPESDRDDLRWVARQLGPAHHDFLAGFAERTTLAVDGLGAVLFCHAAPRGDEELITAATPEARVRAALAGVARGVVVGGHTHMPFDRRVGAVRLVNPGSVGMPYGAPGAYWALLGPGVELRRTPYDLEGAAARIRAGGHPQADEFAEGNVLHPPTAAEAIAVFEGMAP